MMPDPKITPSEGRGSGGFRIARLHSCCGDPRMRGYQEARAHSRHCERSEAIHVAAQRKNGLLRFARNDVQIATLHTVAIPRGFGVSSTPRLFSSITAVFGKLDRRPQCAIAHKADDDG